MQKALRSRSQDRSSEEPIDYRPVISRKMVATEDMVPSCSSANGTKRGPIPITVITGLLGSGKTTLLKRILSENHGLRVAVLLNEYAPDDKFTQIEKPMFVGESGNLYEQWLEVNNGCLCCSAKGQTLQALESLSECACIDCVVIECSGLANPGPIINSVWVDDGLNSSYKLNGVVTVVDARRLLANDSTEFDREFKIQLAYADHVIVNKMDLVTTSANCDLEECKERCRENISECNPLATCSFTKYCNVDIMSNILDIKGYEDPESVRAKMSKISSMSGPMHSSNMKYIRCITVDTPVGSYFRRSKLNELMAELLWNNQEDPTKDGKFGRIRRLKASVVVKEKNKAINWVIVQAVDENYDEFELPYHEADEKEVSRFVFIGENMPEKLIRKTVLSFASSPSNNA